MDPNSFKTVDTRVYKTCLFDLTKRITLYYDGTYELCVLNLICIKRSLDIEFDTAAPYQNKTSIQKKLKNTFHRVQLRLLKYFI